MFTGLVEEKGTITAVEELGDSVRLTIRGPVVTSDAGHGDSIAVNGCCLTVMAQDGDTFGADVMKESLDKTSLGDLGVGDEVNLERAMRAGARLGGHIVQGHVDGTGRIIDRTPSEHWEVVRIGLPSGLAKYLVDKGSITVDGTSLTVVEVADADASTGEGAWFSVSLIPTTLADTTLGTKGPGDRVNLEVDILAKHVERLLAAQRIDPKEDDA
ncbi:riboflavin synthase [Aeromicrobium sp. SMF47]|uniref:Riboflavin synthase n=1 Tax=Aeromicrobium yanjiei TaxID=2662028 RepID=A0A5Q2MKR8_9ACTN|nr:MULTISPECIES: riboflavin synthase [Aeromicrobium]MRJ77188.1 riboflavin synthase [Aeromicrobium yanjiei]MRK01555.1 riboflavin synthase [Aeromicrobium sp. S22]QGG41676.1 riboflavin synthase [Aeromicrobium yanjiei]